MKQYFIPALFLAGTLFFSYLYLAGPLFGRGGILTGLPSSERSIKYNQLQQLKQETAVKMDIEKQQALINKRLASPDLEAGYDKKNKFHKTEPGYDLGPAATDLDSESSYEAMTLDQRMDEFLARKQEFEEIEEAQKQAYVEAFILEAKKIGFIVKINSDLEIESVTKIKKK